MATEKVTKRTMYETIAKAMADNEQVVAFCNAEIATLDRKAEKNKAYRSNKKASDYTALNQKVLGVIGATPRTATEIANALGEGYSAQKVTPRLKELVEQGAIVVTVEKRKNYYTLNEGGDE